MTSFWKEISWEVVLWSAEIIFTATTVQLFHTALITVPKKFPSPIRSASCNDSEEIIKEGSMQESSMVVREMTSSYSGLTLRHTAIQAGKGNQMVSCLQEWICKLLCERKSSEMDDALIQMSCLQRLFLTPKTSLLPITEATMIIKTSSFWISGRARYPIT